MIGAVSDLGEFGLIGRIRDRVEGSARPAFLGDDAAVVDVPAGQVLYTTDLLVETVDFDLGWCSGDDVGWKALAINVSDVAAMGGRALFALATLALPLDSPIALVDGIVDGLVRGGGLWGVRLVGGDVSRADKISLSVALLGAPSTRVVYRSGAQIGDAICVTGVLGGAAGGLRLLRASRIDEDQGGADLVSRLLRPNPRLIEGQLLAAAGASAMIDVSDGLLADLGHILAASGVGCEVHTDAIPIDPALAGVVAELDGADPLTLAKEGGEDFELLFTLAPATLVEAQEALDRATGTTISQIGHVTDGPPLLDGDPMKEPPGWDHLRIP